MADPVLELYAEAFTERFSRAFQRDPLLFSEPGIRGAVSESDGRIVRLLALDDRGCERLAAEVAAAREGVVHVFDGASRCAALLDRSGWRADRPSDAMVLREISATSDAALPDGLRLRPVGGDPGSISLDAAIAVALAADAGIADPAEAFAFLRSLPPSARLFAAVDGKGTPRATSACDVFGAYARIFFADTEPSWRRRGVGRAMTLAALRAAARAGARHAVLDASESGISVYRGIGFEVAGRLTRYST